MGPKLTRREIAAVLTGAAPLLLQAQAPAPAEDEAAMAARQVQNNALQLDRVDLPMAIEPAFQFKA